ncbi:hypothetical protein, unlikely [Trypanosoma brucei gambiense DAL972]|uniref:Uncharacterized protein n=1 Tax=Trypanosoma brucei gambiense (strain MHOM/CI/86/DAL972) TaxID=679716 RepID=C9ZRU7_TRYB9|nr:hypothetical protein, unlikely [Trypanosoma brucei gambiense DAL972]CBH12083.1 hypothetical protein, unlikely [Trypanosoma brucei gambiense DAL972]|eukprot:XP_011774366.1 hypothetical protein, unlikely [Trypanosoma brucei gambiense DAL972]
MFFPPFRSFSFCFVLIIIIIIILFLFCLGFWFGHLNTTCGPYNPSSNYKLIIFAFFFAFCCFVFVFVCLFVPSLVSQLHYPLACEKLFPPFYCFVTIIFNFFLLLRCVALN